MNLTGFTIPESGRWALDPSEGALPDRLYDIDNDSLVNTQETPDRWDTNPVNDDSDGDRLPDGWETRATEAALNEGLVDNGITRNDWSSWSSGSTNARLRFRWNHGW